MTTCKVCGGQLRPPMHFVRNRAGAMELVKGQGLVHENKVAWMVYPHEAVPDE